MCVRVQVFSCNEPSSWWVTVFDRLTGCTERDTRSSTYIYVTSQGLFTRPIILREKDIIVAIDLQQHTQRHDVNISSRPAAKTMTYNNIIICYSLWPAAGLGRLDWHSASPPATHPSNSCFAPLACPLCCPSSPLSITTVRGPLLLLCCCWHRSEDKLRSPFARGFGSCSTCFVLSLVAISDECATVGQCQGFES